MANRGPPIWYKETDMLYSYVIDTVIQECKEHFLDEGLSEDVVMDLKALWEHHMDESKVVHNYPPPASKSSNSSNSALHSANNTIAALNDATPNTQLQIENKDEEGEDEEVTSADEEPNSEDPEALFETDNILVCQYESVKKVKTKWRLKLKSGIMTVMEKDFVFSKCAGETTW